MLFFPDYPPEVYTCSIASRMIPTCSPGAQRCAPCGISVAHVVNLVANGMTPAQIVSEHPDLEEEDVRQALGYAAAIAEDQVHPIPAGK